MGALGQWAGLRLYFRTGAGGDPKVTLAGADLRTWCDEALGFEPERLRVQVEGAEIETLVWGDEGSPGILLVHGGWAHAEWWSHVAPHLADRFRVAAVTLSFAGAWRERYSYEGFGNELWTCAKAAGLYSSGQPPAYVGHSLGGNHVIYSARRFPERMSVGILIDCGIILPPQSYAIPQSYIEQGKRDSGDRPHKIYDSVEEAVAEFRLIPAQPCANDFILDHIARRSLRAVPPEAKDGAQRWTWRYDPEVSRKWDLSRTAPLSAAALPRMAHIWGELSARTAPFADAPSLLDLRRVGVPLAHHHVMLDQPVALVAALRALLAT